MNTLLDRLLIRYWWPLFACVMVVAITHSIIVAGGAIRDRAVAAALVCGSVLVGAIATFVVVGFQLYVNPARFIVVETTFRFWVRLGATFFFVSGALLSPVALVGHIAVGEDGGPFYPPALLVGVAVAARHFLLGPLDIRKQALPEAKGQ
jgi:hypothetical protein